MYASAGIGRTKSGAWAGRAPFAIHCLRFADSSVEVLMSDAQYDYTSPVAAFDTSYYALRCAYQPSLMKPIFAEFFGRFRDQAREAAPSDRAHELVRITPRSTEVIAQNVRAFDVASNGELVCADDVRVFQMANGSTRLLARLEHVEQIVIE